MYVIQFLAFAFGEGVVLHCIYCITVQLPCKDFRKWDFWCFSPQFCVLQELWCCCVLAGRDCGAFRCPRVKGGWPTAGFGVVLFLRLYRGPQMCLLICPWPADQLYSRIQMCCTQPRCYSLWPDVPQHAPHEVTQKPRWGCSAEQQPGCLAVWGSVHHPVVTDKDRPWK